MLWEKELVNTDIRHLKLPREKQVWFPLFKPENQMCVPTTPTFSQIPQIWTNARMAPICAKHPTSSAKTRLDHIRVPVKMAFQEMAKQLALVCPLIVGRTTDCNTCRSSFPLRYETAAEFEKWNWKVYLFLKVLRFYWETDLIFRLLLYFSVIVTFGQMCPMRSLSRLTRKGPLLFFYKFSVR